jgi:hypothetical protein
MVSFKGPRGPTPKFDPTTDGYCDDRVFGLDVGLSLAVGQPETLNNYIRLPPDVVSRLSSLFEHILDQLHPILRRLATSDAVEPDEIINYTDMLLLWSCTIAFGKYLHRPSTAYFNGSSVWSNAICVPYTENPSPGLGTQIIQAVGPSFLSRGSEEASILKICSAMLAVLISELCFYSGEEESDRRESHLQRIITAYVVFAPLSMGKSASVQYF